MHRKAALGWLIGLFIAVAIIAVGCGGGDDGVGGGVAPTPPAGTATLNGQVVAASNTNSLIANAVVTIQQAGQVAAAQAGGRTATTAADGGFAFTNLPAGDWIVMVTTPQSEEFGTASARVSLNDDQTTTVSMAVLPLGLATPQQIQVDPVNTTVDVNGRIAYRAQVTGPANQILDVEPTWVVNGEVGQITPDGIFTAHTVGNGSIRAFAGNAEQGASVTVVAPRPPQVTSFRVNPQTLPATGGEIFVSAAVKDGDGVQAGNVTVEILPAGGAPIVVPMQVSNPDSAVRCPGFPNCFVDASFGATYQVPANDNTPTPDGVQAEEQYTVSVRVTDRSGASSQSEFVDFVVQGIDPPPSRPGI
ncbi:MAG: hypothetical protein GF393_05800 [Armatimonadia bacterium]|nr:hypothetical protein [Armatimonadia bacterium]